MEQRSRTNQGQPIGRSKVRLNPRLDKNLLSYVAAASAAGVGMLAFSQLADGEVVYTPANTPILINVPLALDLNHDGTTDFQLSNNYIHRFSSGCSLLCTTHAQLKVSPAQPGNAIWATSSVSKSYRGPGSWKSKGGKKVQVALPGPWGIYVAEEREFAAA